MLIDRLRSYVTYPLYHNECYTTDEYAILTYSLNESERRTLEVLSLGHDTRLHQFMDSFPWHDLEELLGEHLPHVIRMTNRKTELAVSMRDAYLPNIFDKYAFHHRVY